MRQRHRHRTTENTSAKIAAYVASYATVGLVLTAGFVKLLSPWKVDNPGLAAYVPPPAAVVPEYSRVEPAAPVVIVETAELEPLPTTAIAGVLVEAPRKARAKVARRETAKPPKPVKVVRREERRRPDRGREYARADRIERYLRTEARVSASPFPAYAAVR